MKSFGAMLLAVLVLAVLASATDARPRVRGTPNGYLWSDRKLLRRTWTKPVFVAGRKLLGSSTSAEPQVIWGGRNLHGTRPSGFSRGASARVGRKLQGLILSEVKVKPRRLTGVVDEGRKDRKLMGLVLSERPKVKPRRLTGVAVSESAAGRRNRKLLAQGRKDRKLLAGVSALGRRDAM